MHFVRAGSGAPPLVFVHGFACSHEDWKFQLEELKTRHEIVACDLRGHGATPGRPHECSIEHYGGDVAALLGNLDFSDAILVGHSMGCRVLLEAARLDPGRVAGLILVDGSRQRSLAIEPAGYEAFIDPVFRQMFFAWSAQAEAILERAKRVPADTGAALWTRMVLWDVEQLDAALDAVRAPLMAIQSTWITAERQRLPLKEGESSPWLELLKSKIPDARIRIIPGVGHFPQLEAPQRVNQLIAEFAAARR